MPEPDFEDDMLPGQGVIETQGHGRRGGPGFDGNRIAAAGFCQAFHLLIHTAFQVVDPALQLLDFLLPSCQTLAHPNLPDILANSRDTAQNRQETTAAASETKSA